jgi:hypothetical protein
LFGVDDGIVTVAEEVDEELEGVGIVKENVVGGVGEFKDVAIAFFADEVEGDAGEAATESGQGGKEENHVSHAAGADDQEAGGSLGSEGKGEGGIAPEEVTKGADGPTEEPAESGVEEFEEGGGHCGGLLGC